LVGLKKDSFPLCGCYIIEKAFAPVWSKGFFTVVLKDYF